MPICPKCLSRDLIRHGTYDNKQRWHCLHCRHTTTSPRLRMPKNIEQLVIPPTTNNEHPSEQETGEDK
jgi:transposase-like protein